MESQNTALSGVLVTVLLLCHCDQRPQLTEGKVWAHGSRVMGERHGSDGHGSRKRRDLISTAGTRQRVNTGWGEAINTQSPPPVTHFLQQGSTSQREEQTRHQVLTHPQLWGHFSFKSPQIVCYVLVKNT